MIYKVKTWKGCKERNVSFYMAHLTEQNTEDNFYILPALMCRWGKRFLFVRIAWLTLQITYWSVKEV